MNEPGYDALRRTAGDVPRETFERLVLFEQRFAEWNKRINLVSAADLDHLWPRHILDSAQLVRWAGQGMTWLDFGSGGGFPGAIIAIMLAGEENTKVHLVESNRKKAAFLARIVAETGARAIVHPCRIEDCLVGPSEPDIVTARAVAALGTLFGLAERWLGAGATGLFQKGRDYRRELQDCSDAWAFDLIEHKSETDPKGVILEVTSLRRR